MIDLELLESLVRLLDESSLDSLEIERGDTRIKLGKSPEGGTALVQPPPHLLAPPALPALAPPQLLPPSDETAHPEAAPEAPPPDAAAADLADITSPMVGTFYRAPSPEADPYVEVGAKVGAGDVLCVIEAMKLMNELECDVAGRIVEICADNAEPVDYGQVLFRVEPT